MNITSRNKQLAEIDKTHMAIKKEIWKAKSTVATGNEVKEGDENGDYDDDDNDNDNSDNKSKDKQKDNRATTNTNSSNASQSDNTTNSDHQDSKTNTGNSTTGTEHSATQFTFNTPISPVKALSSPQSPMVEHPTPTMRSPASPVGSVTYSSDASSTGTDHFSSVIQTPSTSLVASD